MTPIFGAILADGWLGQFKCVWYMGNVYAIGNIILAVGAVGPLGLPQVVTCVIGLVFISVGHGAVKLSIVAIAGDQFTLPLQVLIIII